MSWTKQSDYVDVSGDYLDHTKNGRDVTNAEYYGVDPNTERSDFLIYNDQGQHAHVSVDAYGNETVWHGYR